MDRSLFLGQQLKALRFDVRQVFEYIRAIDRKDKEGASKIAAEYDKRCYWANNTSEKRAKKEDRPWNK